MSTTGEITEFGQRWARAEQAGDTETLDAMTVEDFTLVGPLGFVLSKPQWLARYRGGGLVTKRLTWDDITVREYGDTAVAIGVHDQEAEYQGNPSDGKFRSTHILVRSGEGWKLAGIQLSPIASAPPWAPKP